MISERNIAANFEQLMTDYFSNLGGVAPPETTIVAWLPFYHDMGLMLGIIGPILGGYQAEIMSPLAFLARPARWVQWLATKNCAFSAARTSPSNWPCGKRPTRTWRGWTSGAC